MARVWSPWQTLADRPDITVRFADLTATGAKGACCRTSDGWLVVLCRSLGQVERSSVLAHELVHVERGGGGWHDGMPSGWAAVLAREERATDRATARVMVPPDRLAGWLGCQEGGVTAADVAVEFRVPVWLAAVALELAGEQRAA